MTAEGHGGEVSSCFLSQARTDEQRLLENVSSASGGRRSRCLGRAAEIRALATALEFPGGLGYGRSMTKVGHVPEQEMKPQHLP